MSRVSADEENSYTVVLEQRMLKIFPNTTTFEHFLRDADLLNISVSDALDRGTTREEKIHEFAKLCNEVSNIGLAVGEKLSLVEMGMRIARIKSRQDRDTTRA